MCGQLHGPAALTPEKNSRYAMCTPKIRFGRFGEEKNVFLPPRIEPSVAGRIAGSHVTNSPEINKFLACVFSCTTAEIGVT
jgi:hypothetical protein